MVLRCFPVAYTLHNRIHLMIGFLCAVCKGIFTAIDRFAYEIGTLVLMLCGFVVIIFLALWLYRQAQRF